MYRVALLMGLLVCSVGCQPAASTLSDAERAEVADSLTQLAHRLAETWNAGDEQAYFDCYLQDSTFTFAAGATLIRGFEAFADTTRLLRAAVAQSTITFDPLYVDVLSRDLGIVTSRFGWSSIDTAGQEMQLRGTYTTLMSRTPDGWKVINVAEAFAF